MVQTKIFLSVYIFTMDLSLLYIVTVVLHFANLLVQVRWTDYVPKQQLLHQLNRKDVVV